jgi:REP element-mobilizing transposase RayT
MMKKTDEMLRQIESDLGLNEPYFKGKNIQVKNCWHFYTDGNAVDRMFEDVEDFKAGMNRIFVLHRKYNIIILAFILMDTHVHFILYGPYEECNRFMHMYISMTSRYMSLKYGEKNKFAKLPLSHQAIDNELYLKTAICYVIKNSSTAGLPYLATDYPWSSSPLYFRNIKGNWTAPKWSLPHNLSWLSQIPFKQLRKFLKSRETDYTEAAIVDGIVFPGEYVDIETVERLSPEVFAHVKGSTKPMCANVDMYSGLIYNFLNIPQDLFTPLFAIARISGWCANRMEEVLTCNRIHRPAYRAKNLKVPYVEMQNR